MTEVVSFWLAALILAGLALPLSFRLFRRFPDGGAGLAPALGLTLTGWGYFILRTIDILPPGRGGAIAAVTIFALVAACTAGRDRRFVPTWRFAWPGIVAIAGIFTLFFFLFVAFRSYTPEIVGTEQPMDLMYLNAAVESPGYPPHDPWLAGERASYYYFGYVQVGLLALVGGVKTSVAYNLGLAYVFAASAAGAASLAFALGRWALGSRAREWAFGVSGAAVVLLLFLGSVAGLFELLAAHGIGGDGLYETMGIGWMKPCDEGETQDCRPQSDRWYPTRFFFWFDDTRIIRSEPGVTDTITEFPAFSFLLGDLHPHVMSIPLVILALGLAAAAWWGRSPLSLATHRRQPLPGVAIAILLGALAFQNAWDLLTFALAFAVAVVARDLRLLPLVVRDERSRRRLPAFEAAVGHLAPLMAVAILAYLPWYLDFSSQASGLRPYVGEGSHPGQAFLQFGPLTLASLVVLSWTLRGSSLRRFGDRAIVTSWLPMLPLLGWLALATFYGDAGEAVRGRGAGGWLTLAFLGVATWALATAFLELGSRRAAAAIPVGFAATGLLLLYGAELFVIKDVFYGAFPRLNTIFKLSYQAWILLSLGGAVALVGAVERARSRRALAGWLALALAPILAAGLVFSLVAIPNRTESFSGETTIDGLEYLARSDPSEYALTRWMAAHVPAGEVIIEATGRQYGRGQDGQPLVTGSFIDYTDAGRLSARTGRQTPIGWYGHEVQWRGDTPANHAEFARRQDLVDTVYVSGDPAAAVAAMRALGALWVAVGAVEKQRYGSVLADLSSFLDVAFSAGEYRVYRLPQYRVVPTE